MKGFSFHLFSSAFVYLQETLSLVVFEGLGEPRSALANAGWAGAK
jgi:hypothetical protein